MLRCWWNGFLSKKSNNRKVSRSFKRRNLVNRTLRFKQKVFLRKMLSKFNKLLHKLLTCLHLKVKFLQLTRQFLIQKMCSRAMGRCKTLHQPLRLKAIRTSRDFISKTKLKSLKRPKINSKQIQLCNSNMVRRNRLQIKFHLPNREVRRTTGNLRSNSSISSNRIVMGTTNVMRWKLSSTHVVLKYKSKTIKNFKSPDALSALKAATWSASLNFAPKTCRQACRMMWLNCACAVKVPNSKKGQNRRNQRSLFIYAYLHASLINTKSHARCTKSSYWMFMKSTKNSASDRSVNYD